MKLAVLLRFGIALTLLTAFCVRSMAQSGCSGNVSYVIVCCSTDIYKYQPPGPEGDNAYAYDIYYCCGGTHYFPVYAGPCLEAFKDRPELLDRMLKRFPVETFLIATCSGNLEGVSLSFLSGSRTKTFPQLFHKELDQE